MTIQPTRSEVPRRPQVFLSHRTSDKPIVDWVAAQVEAMDIDCWVAEDHPEPGVALSAKVLAALAESVAMIVLLTESAHSSPYVHQEIGVAVAARMPVIALVDKGLSSSALAMLEGIEYISLDPDDLASSSANLIAACGASVNGLVSNR